jgi:periplasmic copper chaperone A
MTRSLRVLGASLALVLLAVAGCGDDDADTAATTTTAEATTTTAVAEGDTDAPTVTVEGAWARTSPMMATNGAVYVVLTASADDRLVAARVDSAVAGAAEVHETAMDPDSGEMAMRETDAIELPGGEPVMLEPGGYHIMLLDLTQPLEPGTTIEVTLVFDQAGELTVEAEVRDNAMDGG